MKLTQVTFWCALLLTVAACQAPLPPQSLSSTNSDTDGVGLDSENRPSGCPDCRLDCTTCPPSYVDRPVEVKVYVCADGTQGGDPMLCNPKANVDLRKTTRKVFLEAFDHQPVCIRAEKGGELHWKTSTYSTLIEVQERQADGTYSVIYSDQGKYEGRRQFNFRPNIGTAEFSLAPGVPHILRIHLIYGEGNAYVDQEVSDEILIDARDGSEYMTRKC